MAGKTRTTSNGHRHDSANGRSPRALRLAEAIADELFRDPEGERGDRLMLITREGEDLACWNRSAVGALITTILDEPGTARG
jgi:hypothetical protein